MLHSILAAGLYLANAGRIAGGWPGKPLQGFAASDVIVRGGGMRERDSRAGARDLDNHMSSRCQERDAEEFVRALDLEFFSCIVVQHSSTKNGDQTTSSLSFTVTRPILRVLYATTRKHILIPWTTDPIIYPMFGRIEALLRVSGCSQSRKRFNHLHRSVRENLRERYK